MIRVINTVRGVLLYSYQACAYSVEEYRDRTCFYAFTKVKVHIYEVFAIIQLETALNSFLICLFINSRHQQQMLEYIKTHSFFIIFISGEFPRFVLDIKYHLFLLLFIGKKRDFRKMESLNIFCLFWLLIPFSTWCLFSLCDTEELSEHLTTAEVIQRIDSFIKAGLDCHNNPGLTITVVRKDEIILAKGYGYKTTEKTEPVTNLTLFGVASLSKAFAVTLILKLIEEYNGR